MIVRDLLLKKTERKEREMPKEEGFWKYLQALWGLDDGKDTWVWWFPPICFIGFPLGVFVTIVFIKDYIRSKMGYPLPDRWD